MRILLTGASSFVGHHVAAYLSGAGHELTATYRTPNAAIGRLQGSKGGRGLSLVQLDISQPNAFAGLPTEIDAVVHIAGATTAAGVSVDEMLTCNVTGTNIAASDCWRTPLKRFRRWRSAFPGFWGAAHIARFCRLLWRRRSAATIFQSSIPMLRSTMQSTLTILPGSLKAWLQAI